MSACARPWRGRAVLVTGGTGFIGLNLVARLIEEGAVVTVFARRELGARPAPWQFRQARSLVGDIRDAAAVADAVEAARPEVVFHLASTPFNPPVTSERDHRDVIVGGTTNVLRALAHRARVRLVHTGSAAEYGLGTLLSEDAPVRPTTALGAAKAEATRLVVSHARETGLDAVVLRLFTPYGPWDHARRLVVHAALLAASGADVPISDGRQQRDFVYIDDVVDAYLRAGSRACPPGSTYNICSGRPSTVREVVELVLDLSNASGRVLAGALPTRPDEIWVLSGDNAAAASALDWRPAVGFREGVARTCEWVRAHQALLVQEDGAPVR